GPPREAAPGGGVESRPRRLQRLGGGRDPARRSAWLDRSLQKRGTRQGGGKVHHRCEYRRPGQRPGRSQRQIRRVLVQAAQSLLFHSLRSGRFRKRSSSANNREWDDPSVATAINVISE